MLFKNLIIVFICIFSLNSKADISHWFPYQGTCSLSNESLIDLDTDFRIKIDLKGLSFLRNIEFTTSTANETRNYTSGSNLDCVQEVRSAMISCKSTNQFDEIESIEIISTGLVEVFLRSQEMPIVLDSCRRIIPARSEDSELKPDIIRSEIESS